MHFRILSLFTLALIATLTRATSAPELPLVPLPTEVRTGTGRFEFGPATKISAVGEARLAAGHLASALRPLTGLAIPVIKEGGTIQFRLDASLKDGFGREGYRLVVSPDGVSLSAADPAGLFYGVQTLLQLLPSGEPEGSWAIPEVTIRDKPQFPWRGMMLDVSRYFLTKEYILRYLDVMAMHKLNVLHWHLIDDPGWRLEIRKYPKLTEVGGFRGKGGSRYGGFYTQDDIREIVQYAAERNITIVPEIEVPAHTLAALVAYPELGCTGKQFEIPTRHSISPELYCPGKETTWTFLEDVMNEVCELFPGQYIHIGGDEAKYVRWKACPDCQETMTTHGLQSEKELQGWMTTRIEELLHKKGRRIIGWDEILECGVTNQAGIMTWHRPKTAVRGAKAGNPVVMALTRHAYFDTAESKLPGEPPTAGWIPPVSLQDAYEWHPVPDDLSGKAAGNILGANACVWTDQFLHKAEILADVAGEGTGRSEAYVDYLSLPRMAALAEVTWSDRKQRDYAQFSRRMEPMFTRYESGGYNYRMPTPRLTIRKRDDGSREISATSPIENGQVRYTLDGSAPDANSPTLTASVNVPPKTVFKTATFTADDHKHSLVHTIADTPAKLAKHGRQVGEWKAGQPGKGKPKPMTFDATGFINKNGVYTITFLYTGGAHRLDIDGVEIIKNDNEIVAKDLHHGFTGGAAKKNRYQVKIDQYETGASFQIKAHVYGDIGNDTNGVVLIRPGK